MQKSNDRYQPLLLRNGDRLTRKEFHDAYLKAPENYRAELISGMVYEPSPLSLSHGKNHLTLGSLFSAYSGSTAGTEVADNATVILGEEDEVQPDLILRIMPDRGGQSRTTEDDYVDGAPELVAEVAYTSRALDLHLKKDRYARAGVLEYIVLCLEPRRLRWFDLGRGTEFAGDVDQIYRSEIFAGLWIDHDALVRCDYEQAMKVLHEGLRAQEHKAFVALLASRKS